ncbi:RagB/SusD family nutrient uptake outer membrane protein [Aurantibacter crassamenti]|uniref:RagB/SusD family nutrient uptake outer membrane protein n=1 Tax=Aurantibacter crassamenti TaxID=1837375 RepID=UPI00193A425C|nr:RagB/SusD family nutrient uptake outer membrane protein [Aurantibacter crassamenti]MBM1106538.1 RagB/SusD family nutrient uptake outer membrane protein [Aurantibacter crassamenti]
MKKIQKQLAILGLVMLVMITSCSKDWLDPQPKSFFSPENVYVDKDGFESMLFTLRKALKSENTGYLNSIAAEYSASDLASPWSQLDFHKLTPNQSQYYPFLDFFTETFGHIKNANVAISRIDDIEWVNQEDRNVILAEALWHKSYWYYRLVHTYGDVPFVNEEITGEKLDFQSTSRLTILAKLQEDLEFAAQWLPASVGPGDISQGAANYLLTKVYLASNEFDKALATINKVIEGPYSLMESRFGVDVADTKRNLIWDLHRPKNFNTPENRETILAVVDRYEAPSDARSDGLFTMRNYNAQWFQPAVLDSQGAPGMTTDGTGKVMYDSLGRGNCNVRLTHHYQYKLWNYGGQTWDNTQDLRRADINWTDKDELLYNNPASVDFGKPVNEAYFAQELDTFKYIYAMPYYIMHVPQDDPTARPMGGNGDWYLFRLAGAYLLRAEAYYWKDDFANAANDINKVRARANALPITSSDVTLDFIFDERARELFAEAPRHSELVRASYILAQLNRDGYSLSTFGDKNYYYDRVMRYNKTYEKKVTLLGNTAGMEPFHALWPVPSKIITANTLGVINQNYGYDGYAGNVPPLEIIE